MASVLMERGNLYTVKARYEYSSQVPVWNVRSLFWKIVGTLGDWAYLEKIGQQARSLGGLLYLATSCLDC